MSTSPSRFSFILKSDNSELDQTVSTLFSYISESAIKDDIPKLVREHLTKIVVRESVSSFLVGKWMVCFQRCRDRQSNSLHILEMHKRRIGP